MLLLDGQPLLICPDKAISRITYHEKLNVILVGTRDGYLYIVDPTVGEPVYATRIGKCIPNFKSVNLLYI